MTYMLLLQLTLMYSLLQLPQVTTGKTLLQQLLQILLRSYNQLENQMQ